MRTQRRRPEDIDRLLEAYHDRGNVTRRAFCEAQSVPLSTLGYYLRQRGKPATQLARVQLSAAAEAPGRFALVLANGRRIECGGADLAHLIRTAEAS